MLRLVQQQRLHVRALLHLDLLADLLACHTLAGATTTAHLLAIALLHVPAVTTVLKALWCCLPLFSCCPDQAGASNVFNPPNGQELPSAFNHLHPSITEMFEIQILSIS
jgi:hypothetical protein